MQPVTACAPQEPLHQAGPWAHTGTQTKGPFRLLRLPRTLRRHLATDTTETCTSATTSTTKGTHSCQPEALNPHRPQLLPSPACGSALGFAWSVTQASAFEKNTPTNASRQEPKLLLYLLVFNFLNFTLFAQLLLSLLLPAARPTNSATWTDYILTKQTVSTFPAYGILFGKKQAMYIPCQHRAPRNTKSQRKKYTMFWQRREKIWGLAKGHLVFLASSPRLCRYTSTLQNNIPKSQNK